MGRDLDALMDPGFAALLAQLSGTSVDRFHSMTFDAHASDLTAIDQPKTGVRRWLLPKVTKNRRATEAWLQFCPDCLRGDSTPYFRRHWRYAFMTTCAVHATRLETHCPWCDRPFDFEGYDIGHSADRIIPVSVCSHCGKDLRHHSKPASTALRGPLRYERALHAAVRRGWTRIPGEGWLYSHQILDVLQRVLRQLRSSKELRSLFDEMTSPDTAFRVQMTIPSGRFESWPIEVRHVCIVSLSALLRGWPTHFIAECKRFNVLKSGIHGHRGPMPYWFDRILGEHLYHPWYKPSPEEAASARDALRRAGQPDTQYNLKRWLGRYVMDMPCVRKLGEPSPEQLVLFEEEASRKKVEEQRAREFPSREEFEQIRPLLEQARLRKKRSRVDLYAVWCAALYRERTRCWWSALPADFPRAATVYWYYMRWRSISRREGVSFGLSWRTGIRSKPSL